ncbi:hypothetical protein EBU71_00280 [bacterium]|nr:hypothetical protein [Candidatus Elulimicrobium humile]
MNQVIHEQMEPIAPWWINYSEGIPSFVDEYKSRLLELSNKDRTFVNTIALATAFTLKSPDLLHDISQTMFDDRQVDLRDDIIRMSAEATEDFITRTDLLCSQDNESSDLEAQVRYAIAVAGRFDKSVKNAHSKANISLPKDEESIRELVALVTVIAKLL